MSEKNMSGPNKTAWQDDAAAVTINFSAASSGVFAPASLSLLRRKRRRIYPPEIKIFEFIINLLSANYKQIYYSRLNARIYCSF